MQLTEITYQNAVPIDGYGPGFFRIKNEVLHGHVIVTATGARLWGGLADAEALLALAGEVDVLFVGTGGEIAHIPAPLRATLEAAGLGAEVMNSPAAARTYNVLVNEGRRVAAALLTV
ncbi:hypothetical protein DI396_01185 [Litorivita pollutaquae]|uniref:Mth938-like domain-containing protein n=1 Tax=Litorivita pollutaquae TaxID=2200892 RepID=A0A2V4NFL7_9RHOB|nr:Mth938-like domain-containing protein [Litorivita pollutaquae]OUS20806.1 hypothetical protein A9Q95_11090 [Rhodobacterales bacterium 59_46_T64]PYC48750.1 hypothetical protein DI396_01185 [Litorivita pollutaquae]